MPDSLPPYRFEWRHYAFRLGIGNLIALFAICVFAALEIVPVWLIAIPIGIHLLIFFDALRQQQRKNSQRNHDY